MVKWIGLVVLGLMLSISVSSQESGTDCKGFFRWDVKTLTDRGGVDLLSAKISDSTLSQMVSVHQPEHLFILSKKDGRLPRFEVEKQVVKAVVLIMNVRIQRDMDMHLILKSPDSDQTMIGEIPDPDCRIFDSLPELKTAFSRARQQIVQVADQIKLTGKPVLVEITGIPFWDARHWWLRGCARNGRELHPVLSVKILP